MYTQAGHEYDVICEREVKNFGEFVNIHNDHVDAIKTTINSVRKLVILV